MIRKQKFELSQNQENSLAVKVVALLRKVGILDYNYEEQADGIHIKIRTTPEHIEERRRQMAKLGGGLEPTQFMKAKIIPLKNLLMQEEGLRFSFVGGNLEAGHIEIVISKN